RYRFDDESKQSRVAARAKVVAAAETALRLDPALGGAYQALAQLEPLAKFAEREALHMKAVSAASHDPTVLTNVSVFLAEVNRPHEAFDYARQAYQLDPMYPWAANWYANVLDGMGLSTEARKLRDELCARWPDNALILRDCMNTAAAYGDWDWFD